MKPPTKSDLEAAARAFFDEEVRSLGARSPLDEERDEELAFNVEMTGERIGSLESQLRNNAFDGKVRHLAHQIAVRAGASGEDVVSLEVQQLAARVEREQMRLLLHQLTAPWQEFQIDDALLANARLGQSNFAELREPPGGRPSVAEAKVHVSLPFPDSLELTCPLGGNIVAGWLGLFSACLRLASASFLLRAERVTPGRVQPGVRAAPVAPVGVTDKHGRRPRDRPQRLNRAPQGGPVVPGCHRPASSIWQPSARSG